MGVLLVYTKYSMMVTKPVFRLSTQFIRFQILYVLSRVVVVVHSFSVDLLFARPWRSYVH